MPLYYGNPETLKTLNKNTRTLEESNFDQQVETWNSLIEPLVESHLRSIFSSWPEPDSTDSNAISTLWHLAMTLYIQQGKFATNTLGSSSSYGESNEDKYSLLLQQIKSGSAIVPGAVRISTPKHSSGAKQRWKISENNQPDQPEGVGDKFQRGTRR